MTALLILLIVVLAAALTVAGLRLHRPARRSPAPAPEPGARRILFPFVGSSLSKRALDAALRLAAAEDATLMPVFLAQVPMTLPLQSPLPRQGAVCISLQEAIEQRAAAFGVPVDARVERGRTYRHALRRTIANERFARIVIAAASAGGHGFGPDDVAWLLGHAPGEIVVLRPGAEDRLLPAAPQPRRRRAISERRGSRVRHGDVVHS